MLRDRSRSARLRCALVPHVSSASDIATPRAQVATNRVADRLWQRASRHTGVNHTVSFPWNEGCRRRLANATYEPPVRQEQGRCGCVLCGAGSSRFCCCGAEFAETLDPTILGVFVSCVRSPHVPVLRCEEAWDQEQFLEYPAVVICLVYAMQNHCFNQSD